MAASILAPRLCRCLFSVVELNGQNFKHILLPNTRFADCHQISPVCPWAIFTLFGRLWGWVETEFSGE